MIRKTILGGIFFLIPVAFLALLLGKAFEIALLVAEPIGTLFPPEDIAGVALANILAIILLLVICFLAGLAANLEFISKRIKRVDGLLLQIIPGYSIAKSVLSGVTKQSDFDNLITPVLVQFDDHQAVAFEIERMPTKVVVFLPGAPAAWSGVTVVVDIDRVMPLDLPTHQVTALLRMLGRGTQAALANPDKPLEGNEENWR